MTDARSEAAVTTTADPKAMMLFFAIVGLPVTAFALLMSVTVLFYPSTPLPVLNLAYQYGCVVEVLPRFGVELLEIEGRTFCAPKGQRDHPPTEDNRQQILAAIDARRASCLKRIEGHPAIVRWAGTVAAPRMTPESACGRVGAKYRITGP